MYLIPIFLCYLTCPSKMIKSTSRLIIFSASIWHTFIHNLQFMQCQMPVIHHLVKVLFQVIIQCTFQSFTPHILPLIKHHIISQVSFAHLIIQSLTYLSSIFIYNNSFILYILAVSNMLIIGIQIPFKISFLICKIEILKFKYF